MRESNTKDSLKLSICFGLDCSWFFSFFSCHLNSYGIYNGTVKKGYQFSLLQTNAVIED